jgi:hypothetical protein
MHCSLFHVSLVGYIDSLLCDGRGIVIFVSKGGPILETECDGDTKTHCFGPKPLQIPMRDCLIGPKASS